MTLRELINAVLDKGHLSFVTKFIHKEYYSDQPKSEQGAIYGSYQVVLGELLELGPQKPEYEIYVHEKEDGGEKFTDVSLYCDEEEKTYAMDLTDWADIIDAKIKHEFKLSNTEILAHILWEITFYGSTQKKVQLSHNNMEQLLEEVRKTFGDDVEETK